MVYIRRYIYVENKWEKSSPSNLSFYIGYILDPTFPHSSPTRRTNAVLAFFAFCLPPILCVGILLSLCSVRLYGWNMWHLYVCHQPLLGCYKSYVIVVALSWLSLFFFLDTPALAFKLLEIGGGLFEYFFFIICYYVVVANHLLSFSVIVFYLPCVLLCRRGRYYMLLLIQSF